MLYELLVEVGKWKDTATALSPFLALAGALLLDAGNSRRQRRGFLNDRGEKERERRLSRRREIYAEAEAQVVAFTGTILMAYQPGAESGSAPHDVAKYSTTISTVLAKAASVAEPKTARLLGILNKELNRITLSAAGAYGPLLMKDFEIQQQVSTVQMALAQQKHSNDKFGAAVDRQAATETDLKNAQVAFAFWTDVMEKARAETDRLRGQERAPLWDEFARFFRKEVSAIKPLVTEVRKAMRADLGLPNDPLAEKEADEIWAALRSDVDQGQETATADDAGRA